MKLPLKRCANGCDAPPCPPSLVVCRDCLDALTAKFESLAAGLPLLPLEGPDRDTPLEVAAMQRRLVDAVRRGEITVEEGARRWGEDPDDMLDLAALGFWGHRILARVRDGELSQGKAVEIVRECSAAIGDDEGARMLLADFIDVLGRWGICAMHVEQDDE